MITLQSAELNHHAWVALDKRREMSAANWKSYTQKLAGLPVLLRRNGVYMGLAYVMEREHQEKDGDSLTAHGQGLADLCYTYTCAFGDTHRDVPGTHPEIGQWIASFAPTTAPDGSPAARHRMMQITSDMLEAAQALKRIAAQFRIEAELKAAGGPEDAG